MLIAKPPPLSLSHSSKLQRWAIFLLLAVLLGGCGNSADTYTQIEQRGTLRIGIDPTYPPFENLDESGLHGIDVELAKALSAELNLTPSFDYISYDGLYDALLTNRVDVLLSALIIDETRTKEFAYSEPYFNAGQLLLSRGDGDAGVVSAESLTNKTVAVELGADGHVIATQLADINIQTHTSAAEAVAALRDGAADAAIVDAITAQIEAGRRGGSCACPVVISAEPLSIEPFAAVTRIGDETLREKLNTALNTFQTNGNLDTLITTGLNPSP